MGRGGGRGSARMRFVALALPTALCACSPMAADAGSQSTAPASASRHPVSGLEVIPLTVTTARGPHAFRVEVARSEAEQAKGLMFRTAIGPDEGSGSTHACSTRRSR